MTGTVSDIVDSGQLAGAATLSFRHGAASVECIGWRDREACLPVERDTLFRIASLSKAITSVAALKMIDEGRFALSDPIARWAPEFTSMRVLRAPGGSLDDTVLAARPITVHDLLTHQSGLTYGAFWPGPIGDAYRDALGGDIDTDVTPDDWIARLAALPLIDQPGATLHYGQSVDLLGLLLARIERTSLGDLLEHHIFGPLGMTDTGFTVPTGKRHRRACAYGFDSEGRLTRLAGHPGAFAAERRDEMTFESGGAGLWSTLDDFLTFARLFVEGGTVNGVRLLRPETLALMTTNVLTPAQRTTAEVAGLPLFAAGHGFGLGVAVVMEPEHADAMVCGGGAGAVGWPGAFGAWWRADPNDGSVRIFLAHNMIGRDQFANGIGFGVYDAIAAFQRATS